MLKPTLQTEAQLCGSNTLHPELLGVDGETDAVFIQLQAWGVLPNGEDNGHALS